MKRQIFALILILTVSGCSKIGNYQVYSNKYPVNYSCNTTISPFNQINSLGRFVSVRIKGMELEVTDSDGNTSSHQMSETDMRSFVLGLGGLIIGTPSLNNDNLSVYAYDLACPICDKAKHRLTFNYLGIAKCGNCNSTWNLNNNGFIQISTAKETRPLYRYPVSIYNNYITIRN